MAALSSNHPFCYHTNQVGSRNHRNRFLRHLCCWQRSPEPPQDMAGRKKESGDPMIVQVQKIGKEVRQGLKPERRGDWKDLALMSVSFAVSVYISQRIVCAYFAWMSIPSPSWSLSTILFFIPPL